MPTVEERLASPEAKVDAIADLRNLISDLRGEMYGRFNQMEGRFTLMEGRLTELQGEMSRRLGALDAKVDRHFVWLMGMVGTGFITIIGALVGAIYW